MATDIADQKRRILEMVAEGDLAPDEAARLLDALAGPEQVPEQPAVEHGAEAVKVVGTFRALTIQADPSVSGAVAEGPHRVKQEGTTLVFEDDLDEEEGFVLFGPSHRRKGVRIQINDRKFTLGDRSGPPNPPVLKIRVNPSLPVDLDLTAGTARIVGMRSRLKLSIAAGTAKLEDVSEPFDVAVDAGSVSIKGTLSHGESKVRCTAGKIAVELSPDSDVRISARSTLGKLSLPDTGSGEQQWAGIGGGKREAVIGSGSATLDLEATTGAVAVDIGPTQGAA